MSKPRHFLDIGELPLRDLRTILDPQCTARAREVATRMTEPAKNAANAADLVENFVRLRRVG